MNDFPTLETERLHLREIIPEDAATLFRIHSDADVMRYFGTNPMADLTQAEALIEKWRNTPHPARRWGVARKSDQTLIGTCGFFRWNVDWSCAMLGYELDQQYWRQGFMREALAATLHWGFMEMGLNRIEAQVHPENQASLQVLATHGFVQEGLLRQAGYWAGKYQDLLQHSLLREEYSSPTL
ncbi:GNAT family N-acetyltransferase [Glaciimonas sp. GS1]|uniref:GNAT family N-acetyltransferase n=2 Tax=Glaciimonas soli TaxID=2590999 RepID=A0A843YPU1_9BURK|nr:GNAT family N-acetyltransferase [Glaciimonas soli]